jgi:hypothetical protein
VPVDRPATRANATRNAAAGSDRRERWTPARDACWRLLVQHVRPGSTVAVCGAGNADDLPLGRLAAAAARVDLLDLDPAACRAAVRRLPRSQRPRVRVLELDVTEGLADRVVAAAARGQDARLALVGEALQGLALLPLGEPPYDLVVGDLLYSQLLFPGLRDAGLDGPRTDAVLESCGAALTAAVVRRLAAAAPGGTSVHLDDPLAWWPGHEQPFDLDEVLAAAARDPAAALALVATGDRPIGSDPRPALGDAIVDTAFWRWPFAGGVDYLVCASVARDSRLPEE